MTRDDSTGGWAAVSGGGLSFVGLRRLSTFTSPSTAADGSGGVVSSAPLVVTLPSSKKKTKVQYMITGHRISDESVSSGFADYQTVSISRRLGSASVDKIRDKYGTPIGRAGVILRTDLIIVS